MPAQRSSFIARSDQPLISVLLCEGAQEMVLYSAADRETDEPVDLASIHKALALAGAWADLDWEEMEQELYRIHHESEPTPPITDL